MRHRSYVGVGALEKRQLQLQFTGSHCTTCVGVCAFQDDADAAGSTSLETALSDDEVAAKKAKLDNDDDDDDDDVGDDRIDRNASSQSQLSWPHCFSTDRMADSQAVMPFER